MPAQVQQDNVRDICMWRARIRATAVFATDGSHGATEKEGIHGGASKASRAYVRHCGQEHGGVMASGDGVDNYIAEMEALIEALAAEPEGGRIIIVMDATSPVTAWMRFGRCHNRRKLQFREHTRLDVLDQQLVRHEAVVFLWQESHVGSPLNGWADAAADRAREESILGVQLMAPTHFSMALAAPRGGVLRWAKERRSLHVEARLRSCSKDTQFAEGNELIVKLERSDELRAMQVRSNRRALADPKRLGGLALRRAQAAGCPGGCKLDGKEVACTWLHVQLFCGSPSVAAARGAWLSKVKACQGQTEKVFSRKGLKFTGGFHEELGRVVAAVSKAERGAPKGGRAAWQEGKRELKTADLDAESPEGERVKGAITRVVGNLVGTTGDTKRDKDADVLRAVKEMVQAGLQVQAEGDEVCRAVRKQLSDENSSLASVRKFASRWRKLVLQGGPARAEKLRRVYAAEEGIRQVARRAKAAKAITVTQERAVLARLRSAVVLDAGLVRGGAEPEGAVGACGWQLALGWHRWRARVRKRQGCGEPYGEEAKSLVAAAALGVANSDLRGWLARRAELLTAAPARSTKEGVAAVGRATRALGMLGGQRRAGQLRVEAELQRRRAEEAERVRRQAAALANAIASGTCSGEPQQPVGARIRIDRTRIRGERAANSRKRARRAATAVAVAQLRKGLVADDGGFWAVKRIVEVIRFSGRGRRIDVKVQWEGVDERGRPWAKEWVRMGKLTEDLKKEVWRRLEAEEDKKRHRGVQKRGWRRCARLQATRARLESDSESDDESSSESDSEPSEYDSEEELSIQELLRRDETRREEKVRERERAAGRARAAEAAEAADAARREASAPRRTRGGAIF